MSVNNYALHGKIIIIIVVATRPNVERNACMYRCNNQMRHVRVRAELIKREIKGNTNTKSYWFSKGRVKGVPWLPCRGSLSFALFRSYLFYARRREPLVARDINLSLFHADVAVWKLAKPVLYFVTFLNFRVCHTTKIALFRLFGSLV